MGRVNALKPFGARRPAARGLALLLLLGGWPGSAQAHGEGWVWWSLAGSGGLLGLLLGFGVGALAWRCLGFGSAFALYLLALLLCVAVGFPGSADALALALMVGAAAGVLPFALGFFPGRWLGERWRMCARMPGRLHETSRAERMKAQAGQRGDDKIG